MSASVCMCVCLCMQICVYICVYVGNRTCLCTLWYVSMCVYQCIWLCICLRVCSVCLFLFVCACVCLSLAKTHVNKKKHTNIEKNPQFNKITTGLLQQVTCTQKRARRGQKVTHKRNTETFTQRAKRQIHINMQNSARLI